MEAHQALVTIHNKGIFNNEDAALTHVLQRLIEAFDPFAVWLFGSRATGQARPDSDFDLLLVAKPQGSFGSNDYEMMIEPLRGLGVGCDIIPCSYVDFEEAALIKTSLISQVLQHGRRLYDEKTN